MSWLARLPARNAKKTNMEKTIKFNLEKSIEYQKLISKDYTWEELEAFRKKYPESKPQLTNQPIPINRFNCD